MEMVVLVSGRPMVIGMCKRDGGWGWKGVYILEDAAGEFFA